MGILDVFRGQNAKRFPKRKKSKYERDLEATGDTSMAPVRCSVCGQRITGRFWRVDNDRWCCTACHNEYG